MIRCPKCELVLPVRNFRKSVLCRCRFLITPANVNSTGGFPGTEYGKLAKSLGFKPTKDCGCRKLMQEMDQLGVDGCRRDFDRLVGLLGEKYQRVMPAEKIRATAAALFSGLAFQLDWTDPVPSLLRLAIERADAS